MSVAEAVGTRPPRTVSTRFLRSELRLIFRRRRNQAGLLVLAAVPVLIAIAVKVSSPGRGGDGPDFFSSITENGLFVALASLTIELGLFLPLAVAAISGDAVAGEANLGTLRYLLTVPVHRARLLGVKYLAIVIFSVVATLTVTVTGIVMGLALFGGGDMTLLSRTQIGWLHPFLITHHWLAFGDLFRSPVAWDGVQQGTYLAVAYMLVFWFAGWARFAGKDVT